MKYVALAILPLVWTAALLGAVAAIDAPDARAIVLRTEIEAVKLVGLAGCVVAALAFERGEYLRRAWGYTGVCYAILLLRDLTLLPALSGPMVLGVPIVYLQSGLVLVANAFSVLGTMMIARAWNVAGIELPGSRAARALVLAVAVLVAIAITGPTSLVDLRALAGGDVAALIRVASDVGDILSMVFIAPLLLTALALRGGLLRWPWALFTVSMLCWLFYDAAPTLGDALHLDARVARGIAESFRALGCWYGFSAGLAQRFVLEDDSSAA